METSVSQVVVHSKVAVITYPSSPLTSDVYKYIVASGRKQAQKLGRGVGSKFDRST